MSLNYTIFAATFGNLVTIFNFASRNRNSYYDIACIPASLHNPMKLYYFIWLLFLFLTYLFCFFCHFFYFKGQNRYEILKFAMNTCQRNNNTFQTSCRTYNKHLLKNM